MKKLTKLTGLLLLAITVVFTGCQNKSEDLDDKEINIQESNDENDDLIYDEMDDQDDIDDIDDLEDDKDIASTEIDSQEVLAVVRSFAVDAAGEITGPTTEDYSSIAEKSSDLKTVLEHRNAHLKDLLEQEGNLDVPIDDLDLDVEQMVIINNEAFVELELEVELNNDYDRDEDYFVLLEQIDGEWKVVSYVSEDDTYLENYYSEESLSNVNQLKNELKMDDKKRNPEEIIDLLKSLEYKTSENELKDIEKIYQ